MYVRISELEDYRHVGLGTRRIRPQRLLRNPLTTVGCPGAPEIPMASLYHSVSVKLWLLTFQQFEGSPKQHYLKSFHFVESELNVADLPCQHARPLL